VPVFETQCIYTSLDPAKLYMLYSDHERRQ